MKNISLIETSDIRMSQLPNAPLIEVVFELRWKVSTDQDFTKYQFLHGDLYSQLKEEYPFQELLTPIEFPPQVMLNNPVHRFRKAESGYPLFQVGPGVLTLNTVDLVYFWDEFFGRSGQLIETFFLTYKSLRGEQFTPKLLYYDFFKFAPEEGDVLKFLSENLKLEISHQLPETHDNPQTINFSITYPNMLGSFLFSIGSGTAPGKGKGLIMQTSVTGKSFGPNPSEILTWLDEAHKFCSRTFIGITKGKLLDSFA